ncbi:MAG: hypothetical protein U5K27_19685 [Desulfotignum sp.]|nr:hypothetical protein [Desulfotignum sp.]
MLHFIDALLQSGDIGFIRPLGRQGGGIAFQTQPHFKKVHKGGGLGFHGFCQGIFLYRLHGFDKSSLSLLLGDQAHGDQALDTHP